MLKSLRSPDSVLLISCYELGHQPLGIAWPLAFLEGAGCAPQTLDIAVENFDEEKIQAAQFLGISVPMHTALRLGVRVAERIRQVNPTCHICFYGLYASLNADYLLDQVADSVIGGEYEAALVALIQALENGNHTQVEGVAFRGKPAKAFLDWLTYLVPNREGLSPLESYAKLEWNGSHSLVGYVEATRGCLHHCLHCPIPPVYGGRFFAVPKEIVLEDIRRLVHSGAQHITFGDPDFLNGPTHSLRIVRAVHEEFPELTFDFTSKIEHILKHRSIFPELSKFGCIFMISAVESLSDTVLANLEKGHTRADVYQALAIVRDAGIAFRPTWVAFTPWTTLDDYIEMLEFVSNEDLIDHVDSVQYTIRLLVPPGSALLWRPEIQPFLGPLAQASFFYSWTHPDPGMDLLYREVRLIVENATQASEDPVMTFNCVRKLGYSFRGEVAVAEEVPSPNRIRPPRLTEPWFCCSEPTDEQLEIVSCHSECNEESLFQNEILPSGT